MRAILAIGNNCFVPDRIPVKLGMSGAVVGYADGFEENAGKLTGTIHIEDPDVERSIFESFLRPVGLSLISRGEPEVLEEIALIDPLRP